jgi:large-conductance mechanosensitive channel
MLSDNINTTGNFNFIRFITFLKENDIIAVAIASIISERISEIVNSFTTNILMPIIYSDRNQDGIADITELEKKTINFLGSKINIGFFLISLIKFFIISYIIFILYLLFQKLT